MLNDDIREKNQKNFLRPVHNLKYLKILTW